MAGIDARENKMIARRQFLENLTALFAAGCVIPETLAQAFAPANNKVTPPATAIYDARLPASMVFAQSAQRNGLAVVEMGAGAGELWYHRMRPIGTDASGLWTGVTLASDYFLLSRLAADAGMKVHCDAIENKNALLPRATPNMTARSGSGKQSVVYWVIARG